MATTKTRAKQLDRPNLAGQRFAACDPGQNTGVAVFGVAGQLEAIVQGKLPDVLEQLRQLHIPVVVEKPQVYPYGKARPNDLITLATYAGMLAAMGSAHHFVLPATWKGQLDKVVVAKRALRLAEAGERELVRAQLAGLSKIDDALDAFALGLWVAGRADFTRPNG